MKIKQIENLNQFYKLMFETRDIRKTIVLQYLNGGIVNTELKNALAESLHALESINKIDGAYSLSIDKDKQIKIDLSYELGELKKDIFFINHSQDEFYKYLADIHEDFEKQLIEGISFLKDKAISNFISDRDGTTNNYCGRYASSVQSVYNSVFLTEFAKNTSNSILLTSAPLEGIGMVDVSTIPDGVFIFAASKGREYYNHAGVRSQFPIDPAKQKKLNLLNQKLSELVKLPEYEVFSYIGSGLQLKFGQTTIARQDIQNSISEKNSEKFLQKIKDIVDETDPEKAFFIIEDTGKDIEIILTVDDTNGLKDFDKGNGIEFLNNDLSLKMKDGLTLICGDTASDIPMLRTSEEISKETAGIFVTRDSALRNKANKVCNNTMFVTEPDILVSILNKIK
ncbi:MAG: trehalose 6-phosphate synthase [Spirochaetes bacterium]|nr:trehalose 6-phosphate synthase [Spirochaetota bacterium]